MNNVDSWSTCLHVHNFVFPLSDEANNLWYLISWVVLKCFSFTREFRVIFTNFFGAKHKCSSACMAFGANDASQFHHQGSISSTCLRAAFTPVDPKSAKSCLSWLSFCAFGIWVRKSHRHHTSRMSMVKAAHTMLVKLTPELRPTLLVHRTRSYVQLLCHSQKNSVNLLVQKLLIKCLWNWL